MSEKFLRYPDLKERGIVNNRMTLHNWIKTGNFPRGVFLGPNTLAWTEAEVQQWIDSKRQKMGAA